MEMSGQLHAAADLHPEKELLVRIKWGRGSGPQRFFEQFGEGINGLALRWIEPRFLGRPFRSLDKEQIPNPFRVTSRSISSALFDTLYNTCTLQTAVSTVDRRFIDLVIFNEIIL
jgi:hypothetical protein